MIRRAASKYEVTSRSEGSAIMKFLLAFEKKPPNWDEEVSLLHFYLTY